MRRTLIVNKIVDHSDVVGASPVGAYIRDFTVAFITQVAISVMYIECWIFSHFVFVTYKYCPPLLFWESNRTNDASTNEGTILSKANLQTYVFGNETFVWQPYIFCPVTFVLLIVLKGAFKGNPAHPSDTNSITWHLIVLTYSRH